MTDRRCCEGSINPGSGPDCGPWCVDADFDPLTLPAAYFDGLPTGVPNNLPTQPEPVQITDGGTMDSMPQPTKQMLEHDPLFDAIWTTIKSWDVNVPQYYVGYCGANGSHVALIYNAIVDVVSAPPVSGPS